MKPDALRLRIPTKCRGWCARCFTPAPASLVLSSWEVNAGSTKLWMETFYREGQTKPPAEAARLALVAVKSRPEYSHPFFWAPFVMTGK